jgi:hypothetical protein
MISYHPEAETNRDVSPANCWLISWKHCHHTPSFFYAFTHYIWRYWQGKQSYPRQRYFDISSLTTNIGTPSDPSASTSSLTVWDAGTGYRMDSSSQKKPLWEGCFNRYHSSKVRPTRNRPGSITVVRSTFVFGRFSVRNLTGLPTKGAPKGEEAAGLQPSQTPKNWNLKNTDFVDIMISKVLCDFSFSRNQPLKSADD